MTQSRNENGMRVRREVLGDAHVDAAIERTTPFTQPFQDYIVEAVWDGVWGRPQLDRRTRSCVTLALLTALRCEGELPMHVRAALGNGVSPEEIGEVLLMAGAYAGVPAANAAFAIADRVLREEGVAQHTAAGAADAAPADQ